MKISKKIETVLIREASYKVQYKNTLFFIFNKNYISSGLCLFFFSELKGLIKCLLDFRKTLI